MRYDYTKRVWQTPLKGGKLLLMLALAHHANKDGECWPNTLTLAEMARVTDRQVRRLLNELVDEDYLAIEERAIGRGKKPRYLIFPKDKAEKMSTFSDEKAEEMSAFIEQKEEKMSAFNDEKADISERKADISHRNQSHAQSLTPVTPIGGWVDPLSTTNTSKKKKPTYPPKPSQTKVPLNGNQQLAFELLVDSEIGVLHRVADELARTLPAPEISRVVDKWLPDRQAGKVETGALVSRLKEAQPANAQTVALSASFRDSELFHRHRLPDEMVADAERKNYSLPPTQERGRRYSR